MGDDGPGNLRFGEELACFRSRGQVIRDFVLAAIVAPAIIGLFAWIAWPQVGIAAELIGGFLLYCAIAFLVRARPHSLRYRLSLEDYAHDQADKLLGGLALVFGLGRFLSVSLLDGVRYFRTGKLPGDRLVESLDSQR